MNTFLDKTFKKKLTLEDNIFYHNELVGSINLEFLHNSLPPMELNAYWDGPCQRSIWLEDRKKSITELRDDQIKSLRKDIRDLK